MLCCCTIYSVFDDEIAAAAADDYKPTPEYSKWLLLSGALASGWVRIYE